MSEESSDSLIDLIGNIAFAVFEIPYISDTEVLGLFLPEDIANSIPGVDSIDPKKLSFKHYAFLLAPILLDRELFKIGEKIPLIGNYIPDPFEDALKDRVYTDGGEDKPVNPGVRGPNRETTWSDKRGVYNNDISRESNDGFEMPSFVWPVLKGLIVLGAIAGVFFVGASVLGGAGGGPLNVLADYGAANVDGPDFGGLGFMAGKAVQTVSCFGDAGCIREWQINNTRRPGSEDVGETYKVNIKNYQVFTGGNGVDVSSRRPDSAIPVTFFLQNTRNGLKGIPARDVQYKVSVRDEGLLNDQNYCETEWIEAETNYGDDDNNVLVPGAGVSPVGWENQLTLRECGLVQPGAGNFVNFVLEVKYDYSSQSTHYVEVMSRDHMTSQGITPDPNTRSETADTPVETYINTREPVVFSENNGDRVAIPFTTRVSVNTDERDTQYRIDPTAFRFQDSDVTVPNSDEGKCDGLTRIGENTFKLKERVQESINETQINQARWFGNGVTPPVASCDLTIAEDELDSISRTGETLTMSADVNYTLKLSEREESFQVFNNLCGTENCPMIVPLKGENITSEVINIDLSSDNPSYSENPAYWKKQYSFCGGMSNQDQQDGCTVVKSLEPGNRTNPMTRKDGEKIVIDEGSFAVDLSTLSNSPKLKIHCESPNPQEIASIDEQELQKAINANYALSLNGDEWEAKQRCGNNNQDSSNDGENFSCEFGGTSYSEGDTICRVGRPPSENWQGDGPCRGNRATQYVCG